MEVVQDSRQISSYDQMSLRGQKLSKNKRKCLWTKISQVSEVFAHVGLEHVSDVE